MAALAASALLYRDEVRSSVVIILRKVVIWTILSFSSKNHNYLTFMERPMPQLQRQTVEAEQ